MGFYFFWSLIFQLRSEVRRLEELKLLNIRSVTDAVRSEIAALWEKCFLSAEQRRAFAPYFSGEGLFALFWGGRELESALLLCVFASEDFTEELLSQHDAEMRRVKQHYEDHRELFDGVRQWEDNWRLLQELEVSLGV